MHYLYWHLGGKGQIWTYVYTTLAEVLQTDSFDDHLCYHFTLNAVYRDDIKRHLYLEIYYESTSYETSIFSSIAMKSIN